VPFSRLASPLHDVVYPVFTRVQDDLPRVARVWLRAIRLLAAVAIPAMLGLVVAAPDLVDVVFGRRWHAAVPVMQILAWVGALYVVQGLNSVLLQALGRTRLLLGYALVSFAAGLGSFVLGLRWGIVGVAGCFAAVMTVIGPLYMTVTARAAGVTGRDVWSALAGIVRAAVVTAVALTALRILLVHGGATPAVRLLAIAAAGTVVYGGAACLLARDVVAEIPALLRRRRG
jgi:PST family polysaccharide transporter